MTRKCRAPDHCTKKLEILMATLAQASTLLIFILQIHLFSGNAKTLTITNNCSYTVWPAIVTTYLSATDRGSASVSGFALREGKSSVVVVPNQWSGRVWGRTLCSTDKSTGNFSCQTGDCGSGSMQCTSSVVNPVTLAEFVFGEFNTSNKDFYDVTVLAGYNLPLLVAPHVDSGTGPRCEVTGCVFDLQKSCQPAKFMVVSKSNDSMIIGCKMPSDFSLASLIFERPCPRAFSNYSDNSGENVTGTFTCNGSRASSYNITFCPSPAMSRLLSIHSPQALQPGLAPAPEPDTMSPMVLPSTLLIQTDEMKRFANSLQFDFTTIRLATHNFAAENKLGEGGFGEVYKGVLEGGQEVAVKRLSKRSAQGIAEFETEIVLVAGLQHKNLVKLLGYCSSPNESLLVYEFLPNSSLDKFLFDPAKKSSLDWQTRFNIISGIARGLLYLHEDSRIKVVHRDLKSSNILLDEAMDPKIADFGLARLFEVDQTRADTERIAGTFGYMAPEYAIKGRYSVKSDVYSFGVIVLEIVSGQRNRSFGRLQLDEALLHRAWRLWNEDEPLNLMDTELGDNFEEEQVLKCIQLGLLCIQENAIDRPRMTSIVSALSGATRLPTPKPPQFFGCAVEDEARDMTGAAPYVHTGDEFITSVYSRD
ncbi:cysteine-rich receptor-like protein kinase 19 isoform X2 [Silene latifolia]|uniref:cysteine-rich receptor-like protein kinase 19 isoform X2 n=1 Tax=Silene latifolia TaxID=37657 RepID=UPI003D777F61